MSGLCEEPPEILPGAPWPIAWECHSNTHFHPGHTCPQTDGSHEHEWVAWREAPERVTGGPGIPVRCRTCGGRKCDVPSCRLRRHHSEDHEEFRCAPPPPSPTSTTTRRTDP